MPTEISAADFNAMMGKRTVSKYGNKRIVIDGVSWDSRPSTTAGGSRGMWEQEGTITELRGRCGSRSGSRTPRSATMWLTSSTCRTAARCSRT